MKRDFLWHGIEMDQNSNIIWIIINILEPTEVTEIFMF